MVSIDDFFAGNEDISSIAVNAFPMGEHLPPSRFAEVLRDIAALPGVASVLVEIHDIQPETWPYSERVYVLASGDPKQICTTAAPLRPSDINYADGWPYGAPKGSPTIPAGCRVLALWWD